MVIQKHVTFDKLKKHNITVPYTTDLEEAATWLEEGETVVSRAVDDGHNGKGLTYITNQKELHNTKAVFWTKFIDHTNEFRINIWRNKVVSVYDKIQKNELFHFKHFKGVEEQPQLLFLVNTIYNTIGLDFCGLDVLRDKEGNLHLLEINSAPTLHKETLENLTKIIKEEIKNG
jgi:glutathione synthase/RimK-type ligase-like ATP-grasp enzyme